jgi:hypothetical protein
VGSIKSIKILVSIKNYTVTVILTSFLVLCVIFVVCHFVVFLLTIVLDHDLTFLCYHRGGHVYHEWPVLNWYQFDISCLYSCKLLVFTPLVILSWGDANMSRRIRRSYTSFSLGLTINPIKTKLSVR